MAGPQPNQQALTAPPTMAALRDDRSRSERGSHPAGLADGSAQQSMASDIAIDHPDQVQVLSQSLYAAVQQNAIHEQLQAQLNLHLRQTDRSQDVEHIADLMHQQALAQQRANMEMQAYEQMTQWQQDPVAAAGEPGVPAKPRPHGAGGVRPAPSLAAAGA